MPISGFLQSQSLAARAFFVLLIAVTVAALKEPIFPANGYFPIDFKYFWLSGQLWLDGVVPYGEAFDVLGAEAFPGEKVNPFFYPPNWWPLASLTALTDARTAENLWAFASVAALAIAAWQVTGLSQVARLAIGRWRLFALVLFGMVVFSHSATIALHIGQPTLFLLCAFTSLLIGLRDQNRTLLTLALVFLLLKPQFSLPLTFALLGLPELSAFVWLGLCFLSVLMIAGLARARKLDLDQSARSVDLAILVAALTIFLMPTHNPDTLLVMPALLLLERAKVRERIVLLVGAALLMRAFSLSTMLEGIIFAEKTVWVGLLDTVGTLFLALACASLFLRLQSVQT